MIYWSEDESVSNPVICNNSSSSCSKTSSTSHDNPPILQSIYLILDSLKIDPSHLNYNYFDVIFLNDLLSEVGCVLAYNNINLHLEKRGDRRKK